LEVDPKKVPLNPTYNHIKPERPKWFDCACCPSNLARTVMGLGLYAYGRTDTGLYVNLYCQGEAKDGQRKIEVTTQYPFDGRATLTVHGGEYNLFLRNPGYAPVKSLTIDGKPQAIQTENGYIVLSRNFNGDKIELTFDMTPGYVYCNQELQYNTGKATVMRGPIVYCAEEVDNGPLLAGYVFDDKQPISAADMPKELSMAGIEALAAPAYRYNQVADDLYSKEKPNLQPCSVHLIPYFLWANRGVNEMRVFMHALQKF